MFRLWKGRKDAENKTNDLNEKNTHEIKSQIENNGTNNTDLDKPGSHLIDLRHIFKIYHLGGEEVRANDDVSVAIDKGEFVAIVGKSGSGKSTLMNILGCLDNPTSGDYILDGINISKVKDSQLSQIRNKKIGFVFQSFNLLPKLNALENVELPMVYAGIDSATRRKKAENALEWVGLAGRMKHKPNEMSGGQRQRVAFARALAPNPQLLLLDEPFAAIDAKVRQELRSWLKEMIEKLGVTSIFVTHDQDEAIEVADEIIITNKGRVEQKGSPVEIYQNPQTAFAASFFGQTSLIENYTGFSTFDEIENAESAILRPEFVKITKKNEVQKYKTSAAEGVVERVSFRGNNIELTVRCKDNVFTARRGLDENPIEAGEKVDVFIYRMFVTAGDKAYLIENKALNENSMII